MLVTVTGLSAGTVVPYSVDPGATAGDAFNFDQINITSNDAMVTSGFDVRDMFGGAFGSAAPGQSIFYDDPGVAHTYQVSFTTNSSINLPGYSLYLDEGGGSRQVTRFQLFAGGNLISDVQVLTSGSYASTYGSRFIVVSDSFPGVTATQFQAVFYGNTATFNGPRVIELDAATPEPATFGLFALGGLGMLFRSRYRRSRA